MPRPWITAVPEAGRLTLSYYSSDRSVVPELRAALAEHCLVGEAKPPPAAAATALVWAVGGAAVEKTLVSDDIARLVGSCWLGEARNKSP